MARKLSFAASRHRGLRLFRWSALALAGVTAGMLLGEMAAGTRLGGRAGEPASFSRLSANPGALATQADGGIVPCPGCADSYGVALRLRADRDSRMSNEFRELGAVDMVPPMHAEANDDYRYGGRFPEPQPTASAAVGDSPAILPEGDLPPADKTAPVPAEY